MNGRYDGVMGDGAAARFGRRIVPGAFPTRRLRG